MAGYSFRVFRIDGPTVFVSLKLIGWMDCLSLNWLAECLLLYWIDWLKGMALRQSFLRGALILPKCPSAPKWRRWYGKGCQYTTIKLMKAVAWRVCMRHNVRVFMSPLFPSVLPKRTLPGHDQLSSAKSLVRPPCNFFCRFRSFVGETRG